MERVSIPYRYGTTTIFTSGKTAERRTTMVSIPYRYGTTTVISTIIVSQVVDR